MWVREAGSRFTISHFHFFTVKHFHALTLSPRWARGTGPLFTTSHFNFHFLTFTFSLSLSDSYFHCHPGEPEKLAPLRLVASWLLSSFPGWTSFSKGNLQNVKCHQTGWQCCQFWLPNFFRSLSYATTSESSTTSPPPHPPCIIIIKWYNMLPSNTVQISSFPFCNLYLVGQIETL